MCFSFYFSSVNLWTHIQITEASAKFNIFMFWHILRNHPVRMFGGKTVFSVFKCSKIMDLIVLGDGHIFKNCKHLGIVKRTVKADLMKCCICNTDAQGYGVGGS